MLSSAFSCVAYKEISRKLITNKSSALCLPVACLMVSSSYGKLLPSWLPGIPGSSVISGKGFIPISLIAF